MRCYLGPIAVLAGLFLGVVQVAAAQTSGEPPCAKCHQDSHQTVAASKHGVLNDVSGRACQSCHGDATEHLKAPAKNPMPKRFKKGSNADENSAICLECHAGSRHLTFWESGQHKKNDVACNDCHSVHGKPRDPSVSPFTTTMRTLEYETCNTCHKQIRSQLLKPSHHPIIEGKVKCSDCHNPHGAVSHAMVKNESVNQLCTTCHADKRGPFMWEHPPVEENCLACHNSHGSAHNKLLNEKVPNLCQDCHDWSRHPGAFYGAQHAWPPGGNSNTRFIARSCLNCHNEVHGSNAPANRGKFYTR